MAVRTTGKHNNRQRRGVTARQRYVPERKINIERVWCSSAVVGWISLHVSTVTDL